MFKKVWRLVFFHLPLPKIKAQLIYLKFYILTKKNTNKMRIRPGLAFFLFSFCVIGYFVYFCRR